jgi:preprotein translocase subunit SecA
MFESLLKSIFGSKHDRDVRRAAPVVEEVNEVFASYQSLSDEALQAKTAEFKARIAAAVEGITDPAERRDREQEALSDLVPEAFAAVKDTCRRLVGRTWDVVGMPVRWDMVPYDVQLIGGMMLHEGKIAEMATGEGKTLVATMPLYLNALTGRGAHLVTVNDYLARRDSEWMGEIYKFLGLTVGCIQQGMDSATRRAQYECDITYGTNNEFGFDYLRDNMAVRPEHRVQRGFAFAIVDEVDSVLIDEARTPLIISGPVEHSDQAFDELKPLVERLVRSQNQWVNQAMTEVEQLLNDPDQEYEAGIRLLRIQRAAPKHKRFTKLMSDQPGLKRLILRVEGDYLRDKRMHEIDDELFYAIDEKQKNVDLLEKGRENISPQDPEQFMVPDLTGQLSELEGQDELDAEHKLKLRDEIYRAYAAKNERIHNIQALLRAYSLFEKDVEYVVQDGKVLIVDEFTGRLMPGRRYSDGLHQAIEAKEGVNVEGETQTLATITLQNFFRMYEKLAGMTGTAETEAGEFWTIYKLDVSVIPTNKPSVRKDQQDVVFRTKREKYNAVIDEIADCHQRGQPVLVGTISVEVSELLSRMLKRRGIAHNVLNAKYHQKEAEIVSQAGQRRRGDDRDEHGRPWHRHQARRGRARDRWSAHPGHRTSRVASYRSPAAWSFGSPRRPRLVAVPSVARRRPHASVRQRAHLRAHAAHGRGGGRGHRASARDGRDLARAEARRGVQLRRAQAPARVRRRHEPAAHDRLRPAQQGAAQRRHQRSGARRDRRRRSNARRQIRRRGIASRGVESKGPRRRAVVPVHVSGRRERSRDRSARSAHREGHGARRGGVPLARAAVRPRDDA